MEKRPQRDDEIKRSSQNNIYVHHSNIFATWTNISEPETTEDGHDMKWIQNLSDTMEQNYLSQL
jgi:hypothetical protein